MSSIECVPLRLIVLMPDVVLHYLVVLSDAIGVRLTWVGVFVFGLDVFWEFFIAHLNFRFI